MILKTKMEVVMNRRHLIITLALLASALLVQNYTITHGGGGHSGGGGGHVSGGGSHGGGGHGHGGRGGYGYGAGVGVGVGLGYGLGYDDYDGYDGDYEGPVLEEEIVEEGGYRGRHDGHRR